MAKKPAVAPAPKPATQRPTETPMPRGSDAAGQSTSVDQDQVAKRAYERYLQRNGEHGRDQEDWLEAEREIRGSRK
jgi:hypothetical protein